MPPRPGGAFAIAVCASEFSSSGIVARVKSLTSSRGAVRLNRDSTNLGQRSPTVCGVRPVRCCSAARIDRTV